MRAVNACEERTTARSMPCSATKRWTLRPRNVVSNCLCVNVRRSWTVTVRSSQRSQRLRTERRGKRWPLQSAKRPGGRVITRGERSRLIRRR